MIPAASFPEKTQLRAHMRQVRAALAKAEDQAAERAAMALPLDDLAPFAVVSGYWPLTSEMSPMPLMRRLEAAGAVLALPVARSRDAPLIFRRWRDGDALVEDAFGIPGPRNDAAQVEPDLVIAPLLAFDRSGARLGQGAGHYDRTLQSLRALRRVFVLGLAYAGQELDHAPQEAHDQRLDAILTEAGYTPAIP